MSGRESGQAKLNVFNKHLSKQFEHTQDRKKRLINFSWEGHGKVFIRYLIMGDKRLTGDVERSSRQGVPG